MMNSGASTSTDNYIPAGGTFTLGPDVYICVCACVCGREGCDSKINSVGRPRVIPPHISRVWGRLAQANKHSGHKGIEESFKALKFLKKAAKCKNCKDSTTEIGKKLKKNNPGI